MAAYSYELLPGHEAPRRNPLRAAAGVAMATMAGAAGWLGRHSLFSAAGGSNGGTASTTDDIDKILIRPGPPLMSTLVPSPTGPSCLFTYGNLQTWAEMNLADGRGEEASLFGAVINPGELAHPTGNHDDVVKGRIFCWDSAHFKEKLDQADKFLHFDPHSPPTKALQRCVAVVKKASGSTVKAFYYFQGKGQAPVPKMDPDDMQALAQIKSNVLIEALPYLKSFHEQFIVVKVGGEAIEKPGVLDDLLTDLVFLEQVGVSPVLVHGGGASISRAMEEAGLVPQWHNGRRVTDAATMKIVEREVKKLNQKIVDRVFALGGAAIGMMPPRHPIVSGKVMDPALGLVGEPTHVDRERLARYATRGLIPIFPPLSVDEKGNAMNTNADDIALVVAKAIGAAKLMFCSSVPGVMTDPKDPSTLYSSLSVKEIRELVSKGIIKGGMIPKVESCIGALQSGVGKIHIVAAEQPHSLLLEIFTSEGIGTELVK